MKTQFKKLPDFSDSIYAILRKNLSRCTNFFSSVQKNCFFVLLIIVGGSVTPFSYAAKAKNTIHFDAPSNRPLNSASIVISAYPDSETPVRFTVDTPLVCSVSNVNYGGSVTTATVSLLSVGICSINANASGNIDFNAPPQLNRQFSVLNPTLTPQSISFGVLSDHIYPSSFAISATATSGLPVAFYSRTGNICGVSGTTVTLSAIGRCTLVATQDGNTAYSEVA